jgi:hypothetical protein
MKFKFHFLAKIPWVTKTAKEKNFEIIFSLTKQSPTKLFLNVEIFDTFSLIFSSICKKKYKYMDCFYPFPHETDLRVPLSSQPLHRVHGILKVDRLM